MAAPVTVETMNAGVAQPGTCPLCHTVDSVTAAVLAAGGGWRCAVCDQRWDSARLESVAAYTRFVADRAAGNQVRR
jgi:transcription elongation factor Elf1